MSELSVTLGCTTDDCVVCAAHQMAVGLNPAVVIFSLIVDVQVSTFEITSHLCATHSAQILDRANVRIEELQRAAEFARRSR